MIMSQLQNSNFALSSIVNKPFITCVNHFALTDELRREKTSFLHMRKQRRRSVAQ